MPENSFYDLNQDYAPEQGSSSIVHHRSYEQMDPSPQKTAKERKKVKPWTVFCYALLLFVSICGLCFLGMMMMPQLTGGLWQDLPNFAFVNGELLQYDAKVAASYRQCRTYMEQNVIFPGIFVDGVHVGGMTVEEASAALGGNQQVLNDAFSLTVSVGDKLWTIDNQNVPAYRSLGNVLEKAYAVGRSNTTAIQSTEQTPFAERTAVAMKLRQEGLNFSTGTSYDHEAVQTVAEQIADYVNRDPVNAQIEAFDFKTRSFRFTQSSPGVKLDAGELYQKIIAKLDLWQKDLTLRVEPEIVEPSITTADLSQNFKMISAFTTSTTKDSNRNTNIQLACEAINGTVVLPGKSFSFNAATGERTVDKGYREAGAISKGESIEEVGGGVCQVSSTLFNAVARADLKILKRYPHAWPSSYVNKGEDATVNWPDLDFQFENNTNSPIFVIMYYKNRKVSAEIWGYSLGDGVTIDLESTITETLTPPSEPSYEYNASLPYGQSKTSVKSRTGYVVETYKVWFLNGKETKRELLHKSTYKAYQEVIQYNW